MPPHFIRLMCLGLLTGVLSGQATSPAFIANPPSLTINFVVGAVNPPSIPVAVGSAGNNPIASFTASVSPQGSWLLINGSNTFSGATPAALQVMFNVAGLAAQTYTGKIVVTPLGGGTALEIPVVLTGTSLANPLYIGSNVPPIFSYQMGAATTVPSSIAFTVSTSSPTPLDWTAAVVINSGPPNWLLFQPVSGNTASASPANPTATVNTTGLTAGSYSATVTFWSSTASNSPISVPVTLTVTAAGTALRFVPMAPCRVADTRNANGPFGGPILGVAGARDFVLPSSSCGIPSSAQAYSLNVTAVPQGRLGYLTIWPTGQTAPFVSTLNSLDGRIKANAAIVPAGLNGAVSVYVTDSSHVVLDINGYFVSASASYGMSFYPITPCRVADTRLASGLLGGPSLAGGQTRNFPVLASACGLPPTANAYSMNFTVVPRAGLGYLTVWPAGSPQPLVSTLNAPTGAITANAAIVPIGNGGSINVYATDTTELVIDVNGYFAAPGGSGALSLYAISPCRLADTRWPVAAFGGPPLEPAQTRTYPVPSGSCGIPQTAQAYSLNATVVPAAALGYLTLWPAGVAPPFVSTLNAVDGSIVANAAIVPAGWGGAINALATDRADLILDLNGYFAP
jgi:hypothetical protein